MSETLAEAAWAELQRRREAIDREYRRMSQNVDLGPIGPGSDTVTASPSGAVAADILHEAAKIVEGDRNATHGDKERSFEMIAEFWRIYLADTNGVLRVTLTGRDVAQMMVLMKIARASCGKPVRDHFVDQAGYSGIAGELK